MHAGVPITFQVEKKAAPGAHVRVVGGPRVLGEWNVERGAELALTPSGGNLWSGTVEGLQVGSSFNFKFVLVPGEADEAATPPRVAASSATAAASPASATASTPVWETIPDRTFQPGGAQTITAVWNKPGFIAGPAAPGTGGQPGGRAHQGGSHAHGIEGEVARRLEATLLRLAKEALAARAAR